VNFEIKWGSFDCVGDERFGKDTSFDQIRAKNQLKIY
jgi:hypothetical protein